MLYAVRISRSYDELEKFFDMLSDQPLLVVFEHESDEDISRTHVHFLVETDIPTDTLKYNVKKVLNVTSFPKTDWSFATQYKNDNGEKIPVDLDFITYMSKGNLSPKLFHGIDGSMIEEKIDAWVNKPSVKRKSNYVQFKIVSEKPETARKRQTDMLDPIVSYFKDHPHEAVPRTVITKIVEMSRKNRIIVGRYKMRDYYDYVLANINGTYHTEWIDDIARMCTKI